MADLRETRRKLKIAIITMAAIDVVAVIILLSPLVGSGQSRKQEMQQLQSELRKKTRQVEPLRGMDRKVTLAQSQIDDFYKTRFPERGSAIYDELGKIQTETGARIQDVKYKPDEPEPNGLQRVTIDADLSGGYLQLVRFLNALERDRMFFIVNSVTLGSEQGQNVKLAIKLETYLKTGS